MADTSAKFGFPYIGGEAQADVTHNEFVNLVQALLQGVEDRGTNTPPGGPSDGDSHIMGSAPTGAWAGRANGIAFYDGTSAAWMFFPGDDDAGSPIVMAAAHTGVRVYVKDEGVSYVWQGSASPPTWVVVGSATDSITSGTTQTQAGATALTAGFNRVTTHGNTDDGVKLPAAVRGLEVVILNDTATADLQVWPKTGDAIEAGSVDAVGVTKTGAGVATTYRAVDATTWYIANQFTTP